jgi:hypothetical protein
MAQVVFGKTADDIKRAILVEDDGTVVTSGGGGEGGGATADEIDDALRATPLPVSAASLPLPTGAATAAGQVTAAAIDTALKATAQPVKAVLNPVTVSLTADTAILAAGDVIADTQVVTNAVSANGAAVMIVSVTLVDPDDQKPAMKLIYLKTNTSLGTENAAPSISDANALNVAGVVEILTTDWTDLGGVSVATLSLPRPIVTAAAAGTRHLYVAALNVTGTPTFAGGAIQLETGFVE